MDLSKLWADYKEVILVLAAGLFSILAALIKSKLRPSPPLLWFFAALLCLAAGAALLFGESVQFHFDPEAPLDQDNKGAMLALGGCLLLAAGGIWAVINFLRLLFGGSPAGLPDAPPAKKR
jgi:hypothetical protein